MVAEGGCLFALERLDDALARGARIHGEVIGYHVNSDAADFVLPQVEGQTACMRGALRQRRDRARRSRPAQHARHRRRPRATCVECEAIRAVFDGCERTCVNNTKSYIGHAMGAAGALELAGNLPSFDDGLVHPTINVDHLDPACELRNLVVQRADARAGASDTILNMSFGMLGINSAVVVRRFDA